jgi:2-dehydro-3-deoxy-D-arabinonate dehydratase
MRLCKLQREGGEARVGLVEDEAVRLLSLDERRGPSSLSDLLHADNPAALVRQSLDTQAVPVPWMQAKLLPPVDGQDIWAAGVTYMRSRQARERESVGAAQFYDKVYTAPRPELFFKATADRVVGPGEPVRVRHDSRWTVPEPELALVLSPQLRLVGFTIGNDMSARDIEGENPLYLPQAKVYDRSCALGPVITLVDAMPPVEQIDIRLQIERQGRIVFEGSTPVSRMVRPFEELITWLGRENSFPHGAILLTGTGVVPPDDFSLQTGDTVHIDITGIGRLTNPVEQMPTPGKP